MSMLFFFVSSFQTIVRNSRKLNKGNLGEALFS